ncbi:MAG: GNAT family N-acetyltransferase [FCB group bacterium]|nr:GNAT family N-acetyltransferase [FCB group bacterium]
MNQQPPEAIYNEPIAPVETITQPEKSLPEPEKFNPIISGNRLYLREVRLSDVNERYYKWMSDPAITRYLETRYVPQSLENIATFVRRLDGKADEPFMAICTKDEGQHIGNIKLGPINWMHRRAEVSLLIGEKEFWGGGYATEAISLITRFAFETLSLNKLNASCYEANRGSARAFEKCGYRAEGYLRDHCLIEGETANLIMLGITLKNYLRNKRK